MFNPIDWYWKKDNATDAFSSARMTMVGLNDAGYLAHIAAYGNATRWPNDSEGNQSQAALQDLLNPYNLDASLVAYAARKRWQREIRGIVVGGVAVATDDRSKQMIMGARIAAEADANFTTPWVAADGSVSTLTSVQVIGVSNAVLAHVQDCFSIFATVRSGINGNTISSRAQVDSAFEA
jgi:hypothetical protein